MRYVIKYNNRHDDADIGAIISVDHPTWTPSGWIELDGSSKPVYGTLNILFLHLGGDEDRAGDLMDPYFRLPRCSCEGDVETISSSNLNDESVDILNWLSRTGADSPVEVFEW